MAQDKKVTVALRRTFGYQGAYYGPGSAVSVPEGLASSLALTPGEPGASARGDASEDELPTIAELEAALEGKSAAEIKAMRKRDARTTAGPIYDRALEEA